MNKYIKCIVPSCPNTKRNAPVKIFLTVPRSEPRRSAWLTAAGLKRKKGKSNRCCEDHFDLAQDADNWIRFQTIGSQLSLRADVVPHKHLRTNPISKHHSQFTESAKRRKFEVLKRLGGASYEKIRKQCLSESCARLNSNSRNDVAQKIGGVHASDNNFQVPPLPTNILIDGKNFDIITVLSKELSSSRSPPSGLLIAPQPFEQMFTSSSCSTSSMQEELLNGEALVVPKSEPENINNLDKAHRPTKIDDTSAIYFQRTNKYQCDDGTKAENESHPSDVNNLYRLSRPIKTDPDAINFQQTNQEPSDDVTKPEEEPSGNLDLVYRPIKMDPFAINLEQTNQNETDGMTRTTQNGIIEMIKRTTGNSPPSIVETKVVLCNKDIEGINVAAHWKLLGDRLTIIGETLKDFQGPIALSGTLSVLMDSLLCARAPILTLTQQLPELQECSCIVEQLQRTLTKVVFMAPSLLTND